MKKEKRKSTKIYKTKAKGQQHVRKRRRRRTRMLFRTLQLENIYHMSCGTYTRSCLLLKATAGMYRRGWWVNEGERWHMFHVFFPLSLVVPALCWPVCPREKDGAAPIPNLDKVPRFPVSPYLSHSPSFSHLILVCIFFFILFYFTFFVVFFRFYIPDTIIVYIVCVCVYLAVLNPLTQSS